MTTLNLTGGRAAVAHRRTLSLTVAMLVGIASMASMSGCGPKPDAAAGAPPGGAPPRAQVGVITVAAQPIALATELPGRLEASRVAQVRARVAGIVQQRLFTEGAEVRAGQALFAIDAAPYQASAASAQALLARAQANLTQASAQAERFEPLLAANAISKQDFINAVAAQKTAQADVAAARAALQTAQINLGYASVTAPIKGRIGRALVTEGALVGQGDATALAVVQQIDPIYVNFTQSTTDVLRLRKAIESGQFKRAGAGAAAGAKGAAGQASVRVVLEDGSVYERPGKLLFSDLTVDASSGQITLRAELPNPAGLLLPGMFVRVRLEQAQAEAGIALPQQAVTRGTNGDTVMVVAADGTVASRPVKIGSAVSGQWVVLDGLKPGEQVMVDGFQKLRGNAPVKAVPWSAGGAASGAASGSASGASARAPAPAPSASAPASSASGG